MENEGLLIKNKLKSTGLEMNYIAKSLKMTRQNLNYHLRKSALDESFREKVKEVFPGIFTDGKQVLADDVPVIEETKGGNQFINLSGGQYVMLVPLVEEYAYAGYLSGFRDAEFINELPKHPIIVDGFLQGHYFAFRVMGDSMRNEESEDSIKPGSIVTAREIEHNLLYGRLHMHKQQDYIIIHHDGVLLKRIIKHDPKNGFITCRSLNPDKQAYPDFDISLSEIRQILNVVNISQAR